MEPSGTRPRGSFGIPQELKQQIEEAHRAQGVPPAPAPQGTQAPKAAPQPTAAPQAAPGSDTEPDSSAATENKTTSPQEDDPAENIRKYREMLERRLETEITSEDIRSYIFRGRLTKEVVAVPGEAKVVFQTLTPTDHQAIDQRMAAYRDEGKYTPEGLSNEQALVTLSYAWVAAEGKPLAAGQDPAKREEKIRKMGAHFVNYVVQAWTDFNELLNVRMGEKRFIKKS